MSKEKEPMLSVLEDAITDAAVELLEAKENEDYSEEKFPAFLSDLIGDVTEECTQSSIASYKKLAKKTLPKLRNNAQGFEKRNFKRWAPCFDHLEMMWSIASELGEANSREFSPENLDELQNTMSAVSAIFPRALLTTQEIICLLKGGYPDGALARWRSLHELTVTAMYIRKEGEVAALPYLLSFHFAARRAAVQFNEHAARAHVEPYTEDELSDFDKRCALAENMLGRKIANDKDGEWPKINSKHRDFAAIERHVGMDHWRPRYKWASRQTHSDLIPSDKFLSMSEAKEPMVLVGASNSGFADPFMMTAISLAQITNTFLLVDPNVDRVVHSKVMLQLSDEMNELAISTSKISYENYVRKRSLLSRLKSLVGMLR